MNAECTVRDANGAAVADAATADGHAAAYDSQPWRRREEGVPEVIAPRLPHLAALVREVAQTYAAQTAFTTCMPNGMHASLSFAEVDALSDAFAAWLREDAGVQAGARVALQMPNCLAYPVAAFGVFKAGCVLVNTNPLYTRREMEHQFADSGAEVLVIVDMFADKLEGLLERTSIRRVVVCEVSEFFPVVPRGVIRLVQWAWNRVLPPIRVPHVRLRQALAEGRRRIAAQGLDVADYARGQGLHTLAALQYTGGTTGVAKGAMLSHGNLLANVEQALAVARSHIEAGREVVLTALPLYHIFAFTLNLLCFWSVGARNVLAPSPRPIQNLQRAFDNYPITWVSGVNTLFNALLNEEWFTAFPPSRLKVAVAGGAALQHVVAERWRRVTGTVIAEGYGLTESSPVVAFNPLTGVQKPDSIGIPAPGTEVRVVDEQGCCVPPGQPGELVVRGPQVMLGYWQRADETARTLVDGWLHTGDVAVMDEDGYFRIVDRKKDLIIVSGFKVYPNEVEDAIAQLDAVLEVGVVGVPDARSGEAVRAYVTRADPALTEDAVRAHCRTLLTDYKVPKQVEFRTDLPKSPIGKILRKDLRAQAVAAPAVPAAPAAPAAPPPGAEGA
jgi:long-chain acyl-CoA synthetase